MAGEEHGNGIGGEEGEVELAEAVSPGGAMERGPVGEGALDDARRFPGGVESGVGGEGQQERHDLRLHSNQLYVYVYVYAYLYVYVYV